MGKQVLVKNVLEVTVGIGAGDTNPSLLWEWDYVRTVGGGKDPKFSPMLFREHHGPTARMMPKVVPSPGDDHVYLATYAWLFISR